MKNLLRPCLSLALVGTAIALAHGYSYSGHKWGTREVNYYINPANSDVSATAAITAIQAAAAAWSTQSNADFRFYYMGQTTGKTVANNGKNEVFFRAATSSNIAETYRYWNSAGTLVDSDIVFYDASWKFFGGTSGCSGGFYIQEIAAHEFGHALGLNHSSVSTATMSAGAPYCATWKSSLDADDKAGVEKLYPPSGVNAAPSVSISKPSNNSSYVDGTLIAFAGSASDSEDGSLSSKLVWTSSRDGQIGTGASFSRVLTTGTHTISAKVTDSMGSTASASISVTVTTATNTVPVVTISSPLNLAVFTEGTAILFSGSATDKEDGSLTSKLIWRSSLDGALGTGGSFSKVLRAGSHVIEASVKDSAGAVVSKKVSITVNTTTVTQTTVSATLTVNAYKVKGAQKADLAWSGLTATSVDVYRSGTRVGTVANSGRWTDNINKRGGGSYTYKVCAAGTSTCTNQVTASF